jgi:hypothetical protein
MRIAIGTSAAWASIMLVIVIAPVNSSAAVMRIIVIASVIASVAVMEIGAMGSPPAATEPGAPRRSAIVRSENESRDVQLQSAAGAAADFGPGTGEIAGYAP